MSGGKFPADFSWFFYRLFWRNGGKLAEGKNKRKKAGNFFPLIFLEGFFPLIFSWKVFSRLFFLEGFFQRLFSLLLFFDSGEIFFCGEFFSFQESQYVGNFFPFNRSQATVA
jgi:hypothetical protein